MVWINGRGLHFSYFHFVFVLSGAGAVLSAGAAAAEQDERGGQGLSHHLCGDLEYGCVFDSEGGGGGCHQKEYYLNHVLLQ